MLDVYFFADCVHGMSTITIWVKVCLRGTFTVTTASDPERRWGIEALLVKLVKGFANGTVIPLNVVDTICMQLCLLVEQPNSTDCSKIGGHELNIVVC